MDDKKCVELEAYAKTDKVTKGGVYVSPSRLLSEGNSNGDPSTEEYQKRAWERLNKRLNGLVNKVNVSNIKDVTVQLLSYNVIRGRGLLVKHVLKAQSHSVVFTPVFASLMAVINSKFPIVGELLVKKLIIQFKRSYRTNSKRECLASVRFIAQLFNYEVIHEIIALELLALLLDKPTNDSIEVAIGFMKECGEQLQEVAPNGLNSVFDRLKDILMEYDTSIRVHWMIQVMFQIRKDRFKDHKSVDPKLDLVRDEDKVTHTVSLDDNLNTTSVDDPIIFRYDSNYSENEEKYSSMRDEIFEEEDDDGEEILEEEVEEVPTRSFSNDELLGLRKRIYMIVVSSLEFEECCHKLIKMGIPEELNVELCRMIVECCSQEKTYSKFYGLLSERFCQLDTLWQELFEQCFKECYQKVDDYETNKIRNISNLFGHLLVTNSISYETTMEGIRVTEDNTTSASRIFLKIIFEHNVNAIGVNRLKSVFFDSEGCIKSPAFSGLFPVDDSKHMMFSTNYFTAIGLGLLTEGMRKRLKEAEAP